MIKKITLDIDGKEIELSLDQANKLKDDLESLLNKKRVEYVPINNPLPVTTTWPKYPNEIWYSNGTFPKVSL